MPIAIALEIMKMNAIVMPTIASTKNRAPRSSCLKVSIIVLSGLLNGNYIDRVFANKFLQSAILELLPRLKLQQVQGKKVNEMSVTTEQVLAALAQVDDPVTRKKLVATPKTVQMTLEGGELSLNVALGYPINNGVEPLQKRIETILSPL